MDGTRRQTGKKQNSEFKEGLSRKLGFVLAGLNVNKKQQLKDRKHPSAV